MTTNTTTLQFDFLVSGRVTRSEEIHRDFVKIGSFRGSHLHLEDRQVSGLHAIIEVVGGEAQLVDLGSSTGTYLNGERQTKATLKNGDLLKLGHTQLRFSMKRKLSKKTAPIASVDAKSFKHLRSFVRPSDTKHYAKRFLSRPSRTDGTIEIAHLWQDHVMSERQLGRRPSLTIGKGSRSDLVVDDASVPWNRYALISQAPDGTARLHLQPHFKGEVFIDSTRYNAAEAHSLAHGQPLRISASTRARLQFGDSTVFIHQGTRANPSLPFNRLSSRLVAFVLGSILVHGLIMALIMLTPPEVENLMVSAGDLDQRIVSLVQAQQEPEHPEAQPEVQVELERPIQNEGSDSTTSASEASLAFSLPRLNGPRNRPSGHRGPRTPEEIRQSVASRGVLHSLSSGGGMAWVSAANPSFDEVATGPYYLSESSFASTMGRISFPSGPGRPGGFDGDGPRTRGRYTGVDGEDANLGDITMTDRDPTNVAEAVPGEPEIGSGVRDPESIRRSIRQNRRAIRACYNAGLQVDNDLEGTIVVNFTIGPTGEVVGAGIEESTLSDDGVERCVINRISRIHFPEQAIEGVVHVNYPFIFTNG